MTFPNFIKIFVFKRLQFNFITLLKKLWLEKKIFKFGYKNTKYRHACNSGRRDNTMGIIMSAGMSIFIRDKEIRQSCKLISNKNQKV